MGLWENYENMWEHIETYWENYGKVWETRGKMWDKEKDWQNHGELWKHSRMELYCISPGIFIFETKQHFFWVIPRGWGGSIFSTVKSSRTCGRPGNLIGDGEDCSCSLKWWILKSPWAEKYYSSLWLGWFGVPKRWNELEWCIPFTSINASNSMEIYHHSKLFPIYCQWQETW